MLTSYMILMVLLQDQMYQDHMKKLQQQRWERQQVIKVICFDQ